MDLNQEDRKKMKVSVIEGDAREVLRTFPESHFHLIVTSPPYNVGVDYGTYQDNLSQEEYFQFAREWLEECYRVLVDGGRICLNIPIYNLREKVNMYVRYHRVMRRIGFLDRDTFIWVKLDGLDFAHTARVFGSPSPRNPHTKYPCELILVMQKKKEELEGVETDLNYREFFKWSNSIWFIRPEYVRDHPAPFPEELAYRLIKMFSFIGQNVLDPFSGSGTTLKVCKKLGRIGTGIEINPEFVKMAERALA